MESPENPTDDLTGKTLVERFHIRGKLGQGGMGAIYTAHDSILDRDVAIKTIARTNLNDQELMRFQREAKAASNLSHPNVIQLLDFGVLKSGQPFMVMELIQGQSLSQLLAERGPQSPRFVLQIIEQVANGMLGVHKSGIIHRDLKTGNIMLLNVGVLSNQPLIKILDFGIAKSLGPEAQVATLTKAGQIFGSPNSMSPEQARGENLDHRSDIYSLGCIAFELLTGQPLFVGESVMDVVSQHINEPPPRLWEVCDLTFPMELERLVAHMVLKNVEDRFQSMEEVIKNLRDVYAVLPDESWHASEDAPAVEADIPTLSTKKFILNSKVLVTSVFAAVVILVGALYYVVIRVTTSTTVPAVKSPYKTIMESEHASLDMVDDFHTNSTNSKNSAFPSFTLNHFGKVTKRLEALIAEKNTSHHVLLIDSEIVADDTKLLARLRPQLVNLAGSSGVTDEVMKGLSAIPSIQLLNLQKVKGLTPAGLACLGKLPHLYTLTVIDCDITDEHLKALRDLKCLVYLKLAQNKKVTLNGIRGMGPRKIPLTISADQPTIVLLAESQRKILKEKDKIVLLKSEMHDEMSASKAIEKFGEYAMDDFFGPVGNSKGDSGLHNTLLKNMP